MSIQNNATERNENRDSFLHTPTGEETQLPFEMLNSLPEAEKQALQQGVAPADDIKTTAESLAALMAPTANDTMTKKQLAHSLWEAVTTLQKKVEGNLQGANIRATWKDHLLPRINTIGIVKDGSDWVWQIRFKMAKIQAEAASVDEALKSAPAATAPTSTTPETATPGKRSEVLGGKTSGKVEFKTQEEYLNTKITDLYPEAKAGDKVQIKRWGNTLIAEYNGTEWKYSESSLKHIPEDKQDRVRIERGDILTFIPVAAPSTPVEAQKLEDVINKDAEQDAKQEETKIQKKQTEKQKKEEKKLTTIAKERTTAETEAENLDKYYTTRANRDKILLNKNYKLNKDIYEIVNNDELWNHYWDKGLIENTSQIKRGFELLGIPENRVRGVLKDAIQQGKNNLVDFEDLLDAGNHMNMPLYKNMHVEPDSYNEFMNEYNDLLGSYRRQFTTQKAWEERREYLENIITGSAMVLDGINKMRPAEKMAKAKQSMERAKATSERKQKQLKQETETEKENRAEGLEKGRKTGSSDSQKVADDLFGDDRGSTREKLEATEQDIDTTDFEALFAGAAASSLLMEECKDPKTGEVNTRKLAIEMNRLMEESLRQVQIQYRLAKVAETTTTQVTKVKMRDGQIVERKKAVSKETTLHKAAESFAKRYFGENKDLEEMNKKWGFDQPDFVKKSMHIFGLREKDGVITYNKNNRELIRNLVRDGFAQKHQRETIKVPPEVIEGTQHEATKIIVARLEETDEKFQELSTEEKRKAAQAIDKFLTEQSQKGHAAFDQKQLFSINVAKDLDKPLKEWQLGLSKEILTIPGIEAQLALGIAVNTATGDVMLGPSVGKKFELSKQWSAHVTVGAGVEVTDPKLFAGVHGGFTYLSKGNPDSAWRNKWEIIAGTGGSAGFNLTDLNLGLLYVGGGFGQVKDVGNQYEQIMARELVKNGMYNVELLKATKEKAEAIRNLPHGMGKFCQDMEKLMIQRGEWTQENKDVKLVQFYEKDIKGTLQDMGFYTAAENSKGISEWGLGVTVDPIRLTALAVGASTGGPAGAAIALAAFGKLGITVGRTIKVTRELSGNEEENRKMEARMAKAIKEKTGYTIEVTGQRYEDRDMVRSREFAGDEALLKTVGSPEGKKASRTEFTEGALEGSSLKAMQEQFKQYNMELSIDPATKMYALRPLNVEMCRVYLDKTTLKGNGLILNPKGTILIAGEENLASLYIKRFDTMYLSGEYDGAIKHTVITISNTPKRTMGEIAQEEGNFIELKYDLKDSSKLLSTRVEGDKRKVMTGAEYNQLSKEQKAQFKKSTVRVEESLEREEQTAEVREALALTQAQLETIQQLEQGVSLEGLTVSPEDFMKKHKISYRVWTTKEYDPAQLTKQIREENPGISDDQAIAYKERLFTLSMSEQKFENEEQWLETRLNWAEKNIYTPYFEQKLAEMPESEKANVTGAELAASYIAALRTHLKDSDRALETGESLRTAVGTEKIEGFRRIAHATGSGENRVREAFDYSTFLTAKPESLTQNERLIARFLLESHNGLQRSDLEGAKNLEQSLLRSRLAVKLMYLGNPEKGLSNPLVNILGTKNFKKLNEAYEALAKGEPVDLSQETAEAIQELYSICSKLENAQLGKEGIPVIMDGRPAMAVEIQNHWFVIETHLMSAYFVDCKNPSQVGNEDITVFSPTVMNQALAPMATVAGGKHRAVLSQSKGLATTTLGLTAVATKEFVQETKKRPPPPDKKPPTEPKPEAGHVGETNQGATPNENPDGTPITTTQSGAASE